MLRPRKFFVDRSDNTAQQKRVSIHQMYCKSIRRLRNSDTYICHVRHNQDKSICQIFLHAWNFLEMDLLQFFPLFEKGNCLGVATILGSGAY